MDESKKLLKRYVESISPHKSKEILVWDSELKGFGLRIFPTGRKTYFVQYRNQSARTRRKKIGVHGSITAELAREEAKKTLGDVAKGRDPSRERKERISIPTIRDLAHEYLENYAKPNKREESCKIDKRMIENFILPRWQDNKIDEISSHDVQLLHNSLKETPYAANRLRALLSKMYNLAIQWQWAKENPVNGVQKYQEYKRTRWLNDEELERLWKVLNTYHNQTVSNIVRVLLLTGARVGEVLGASWEQIDLDKGVWTKPAHTTKQKRMEYLPLSPQAHTLLKEMRKETHGEYLFPGKVEGRPLQTIKKAWNTIRNRANIPNVRIHDLRHTHASHLVSSGLSLSIVGKLLGHTQASTTQRYAHLADEPLRQAASVFGEKISQIEGIEGGKQPKIED
ncbi:MAG: tyrosine-type recombinase/integrase [Alphaproteobacteria bacterium]|jgi:integrase|nr:tyrosine-type recombinase/integrase [Alphaproteobacteria bacterium]MBT5390333.1 tyrosine-type recombinase/integrase [Alphaproteobacteria bacterium]